MSDVDHELSRLFDATRCGTEPAPGDEARIRASLGARLAQAAAAGAIAGAAASSAGTGASVAAKPVLGAAALILKLAGGALLFGVAATAVVALQHSNADVVATSPMAPSMRSAAVTTLSPAPAATISRRSGGASLETPQPPTIVTARSSVAPTHPRVEPTAAASADDPGTDLAGELRLVQSMQSALASQNDAEALRLAGEHARLFPRGTLVEEREGVRAIALCHGGVDGEKALESFARRFPRSPQLGRVRAACKP
ncbi:MAG: hypothetical protein HOO96_04700 [Polyangiaceae bacterium]|nr:hypothetical protein [Polyangiaceae bacterium]